jgi:dihydrofolate reductase
VDNEDAFLESSLQAAIKRLEIPSVKPIHRAFIIGGASLYTETLSLHSSEPTYVDRILQTRILSPDFDECDVFMPDFAAQDPTWRRTEHKELEEWAGIDVPEGVQQENGVDYEFQMWVR